MNAVPTIDVAALRTRNARSRGNVARQIGAACRDNGFFYAIDHGIDQSLLDALTHAAARFFALPETNKRAIAMHRGGIAWRGWFPVDGELTSGKPDHKEGLYFGEELSTDDPRVRAGLPLHGANLFPREVPELAGLVLRFMAEATSAAHAIMEGVALSLDLDAQYFRDQYTARPTTLFRIFHYPSALTRAAQGADDIPWGVGEHTDYGLLTLLAQDDVGGLQVKTRAGWREAPPIAGALVCNIGDMLDRLTGGIYRSTPHRVRNTSTRGRLSLPFFFDPAFDAKIVPLPHAVAQGEFGPSDRWDGANVHEFDGTYGDYLLAKVSKVFPDLKRTVLG